MKENSEIEKNGQDPTSDLVERVVYTGVRAIGLVFEAVDLVEITVNRAKNFAQHLKNKLPDQGA